MPRLGYFTVALVPDNGGESIGEWWFHVKGHGVEGAITAAQREFLLNMEAEADEYDFTTRAVYKGWLENLIPDGDSINKWGFRKIEVIK